MSQLIALLLLCASIAISLNTGAASHLDATILYALRLPRTILSVAIGGSLSVAGLLIQSILGNPLAEPFTLGIASAASCGAVIFSIAISHSVFTQTIGAGAAAFTTLLILLYWTHSKNRDNTEVLLIGVMLNLFFSALTTILLALGDPNRWSSGMVFMLGSVTKLDLPQTIAVFVALAGFSALTFLLSKPLDLVAVNSELALSSGVDVARVRKSAFIIVCCITAISVSAAGIIGFVGLLVPHAVRRFFSAGHRASIPLCFLYGASATVLADVLARSILRPTELPVGIVLSVVGSPFVILILRKGVRSS